MLNEQTMMLLNNMRVLGMARSLREQMDHAEKYTSLSFEERVGLLIDHEHTDRESRKLTRRLQQAHLRDKACIEDIDYRQTRSLDKGVIRRLATCDWISKHQNVIITGATGAGKTYLACALADQACRKGIDTAYRRMSRLMQEMHVARHDGSYGKRSWKTVTGLRPPSLRRSFLWTPGIATSETPRWPTPSSIESCTTPTSSISKALPCAK